MFTKRRIEFSEYKKRAYGYTVIAVITWIIVAFTILTRLILKFPILVIFSFISTYTSQMAKIYFIDYLDDKKLIKKGKLQEAEVYRVGITLKCIKDKADKKSESNKPK